MIHRLTPRPTKNDRLLMKGRRGFYVDSYNGKTGSILCSTPTRQVQTLPEGGVLEGHREGLNFVAHGGPRNHLRVEAGGQYKAVSKGCLYDKTYLDTYCVVWGGAIMMALCNTFCESRRRWHCSNRPSFKYVALTSVVDELWYLR